MGLPFQKPVKQVVAARRCHDHRMVQAGIGLQCHGPTQHRVAWPDHAGVGVGVEALLVVARQFQVGQTMCIIWRIY